MENSAKAKLGSDAECVCVVTIRTPTASTTIVIEMRKEGKERKGKGTKDSGSFSSLPRTLQLLLQPLNRCPIHSGPFKLATLTIPSIDLTLSLFYSFLRSSFFNYSLPL